MRQGVQKSMDENTGFLAHLVSPVSGKVNVLEEDVYVANKLGI